MKECFKYNGRIVMESVSHDQTVNALTKVFFVLSSYYYFTRRFRVDRNFGKLALFLPTSFLISYWYAKALALHTGEEAAHRNNLAEESHLLRTGRKLPE
jgi:hypothetical protein